MRYNAELENLDLLLYGRISNVLHPWDTAVSWGISAATWHYRVHAAFVLKVFGRTLVCDASAGGVWPRPVSEDLADGRDILVLRPIGGWPVTIDAEAVFSDVCDIWGSGRYAFGKCGLNALSELLGPLSSREQIPEGAIPRKAFCSELASAFGRKHGGLDVCPGFIDRFTTPADIAKSKLLTTVVDRLTFAA